jgi:hypothetical protein
MKARLLLLLAAAAAAAPVLWAQDVDPPRTVGRIFHSMVWTGKEAIVWGGGSEGTFFGHGLRVDAAAKTRSVIATDGAPSGRWAHAAVWTGTEMVVWGGRAEFAANSHRDDGGRYDPVTDRWRTVAIANAPTARSHSWWTARCSRPP